MTIKYNDKEFMTDNDLKINILGPWPKLEIKNSKLSEIIQRNFFGGDKIVAYAQSLVSRGMDFNALEEEIFRDSQDPEKTLDETIFRKTATGIGRGHSLGGLSGVELGIHGTKMIDSGLTGLVASRSLVTSYRRRETTTEEIVVPESLFQKKDLLEEYLNISKEVFKLSSEFKEKFGNLGGVETFNKIIPYNNPADLFIVLPLDTMATIVSEVRNDRLNPKGPFLPKEIWKLADEFPNITKEIGQNIMFRQRIEVPRDTYFHYNVFKDPSLPNYALEEAQIRNMPLEPLVLDYSKNITDGFKRNFENLKKLFEKTKKLIDPKALHDESLICMYALREFVSEYNEAVRVKILDNLSWRVWSEQKRHATLRQNVESVYSAVERASFDMRENWPRIEKAYRENNFELLQNIIENLEKNIVIDDRLKKKPELAMPYVYHTAKQLMFYRKMIEKGFEQRDALYIVPKNIRVRTLENYDLTNLINLELPLRLCGTCEPERQSTSWKKREKILQVVPEIEYFLQPKCNIGFCTEGKYCKNIEKQRKYNMELHIQTKQAMLEKSKN